MAYDLDILLINVGGTKKKVYQDLSEDFSAVEPPFWALLTAGFIRRKGFRVDVLDANYLNLDMQETVLEIEKRKAKFNAIVVYSQQANTCTPIMTGVGQLCRAIKERNQNTNIILTGWHPSAIPERTLREVSCDMVAQGEAFYTILGLLENRKLNDVPGLWWKDGSQIMHNERAPNIEDLSNELSDVAWDLVPIASGGYRAFNWMTLHSLETRNHYASMFTSLGCPYKCSFCAIHATFGERRIRYWSPEWTLRQLGILVEQYDVKHINLIDELYVFNPEHYIPIAKGIIERKYDLNFCVFARVDRVDAMPDDELRLLKKAGFNWFKMGIESVSEDVLARAHKGRYNRDVIRRVISKVHNAGIDLCANFMFGLPGDTWDTMQDNLNFAFEMNCAFPSFFCAMAPPGSELYSLSMEKGIKLPDTWVGYATQGYDFLPLPTEHLSAADVLRFRDYAFDAYFRNPRYLNSIETKFGQKARSHIEKMTSIRLKRKILGD